MERVISNYGASDVIFDGDDMTKLAMCDRSLRTCNMEEYWGFPSHA
jgi:hypothetical protein